MFTDNSISNAINSSAAMNYSSQNFQGSRLAIWRGWTSPLLAGYNAPPSRAPSPGSLRVASSTPPLSECSGSTYSSSLASPVFGPTEICDAGLQCGFFLSDKNINQEYHTPQTGSISSSTSSSPFTFDPFAGDETAFWENRWTLCSDRDPIVEHRATSKCEFFDKAITAPKSGQDLAWQNWRTVHIPRATWLQEFIEMDIRRMEQVAARL
ncbi:hypothetical protein BDP27DRAFT_1445488 [Rhodocollybia butyracea]|uniref:Uncharacterized protein n=1 Tax=Rhodocollybia butyracea TaxID=206335 RepID=A0A9P5UA71_9AGAR|nr:hypothetical protein BDP27DRAFT_1445488 [Rhodocollybia butyracea]